MADDEQVDSSTRCDNKLVFRTDCNGVDELVRRYGQVARQWGMVLPIATEHPEGGEVWFSLLLADGRAALHARGVIERPAGMPKGLVALRFTHLDPLSTAVLNRMLEQGQAAQPPSAFSVAPLPAVADPPPRPERDDGFAGRVALSESSNKRWLLEDSLRRMVLVDDGCDIVQTVAAAVGAEKRTGPIIGIDLGTTNSCCAIVKDGRPFIIPSRRGHNTIPSVVAINAMGEELVGSAAKAQMEINPERTIYGSKRLIGRPFDSPVVQQVRDRFHYRIVEGPSHEAAVQIDQRVLGLDEVAARILTDIRDTAQEYLGQIVERAVITVPAFYNENQRQAVRKAGQLAGLQVERILNEPTAAALTFGARSQADRRLLVYDLGGGTFDASVLELRGDVYEVLSTGGDTFLGGVDFDTQLMDHILIEFQLDLGKLPDLDRVAFLRVLQAAEFAKRNLSEKSETRVQLPFIGWVDSLPVDLRVTVNREQLESLVTPLIQRTMDVCESVLAQRSLKPDDIDDILLVGGQTRMPLIWRKIHTLFGKEPLKGVHPDESVAIGAALMGQAMDRCSDFRLVDVLPISIGVGVPGGVLRRVITAGTALPTSRTYGLCTYLDDQRCMLIPVYQGESSEVDQSELLGTVELNGIPPGPAGSRMLEVTFSLSAECLLTVRVRDREAGALPDVRFRAQDSLQSLVHRLETIPRAANQADRRVPEPAAAAEAARAASHTPAPAARAPRVADGAHVPKARRGLRAWLRRLFGR